MLFDVLVFVGLRFFVLFDCCCSLCVACCWFGVVVARCVLLVTCFCKMMVVGCCLFVVCWRCAIFVVY